MKISIKAMLVVAVIIAGLSGSARAETTSVSTGKGACGKEQQSIVIACKNGDPCSMACKKARKNMKICRKVNKLPDQRRIPGHTNGDGSSKCDPDATPPSDADPSATDDPNAGQQQQ